MSYGLNTTLSVFQAFMHKNIQQYLKIVISVYINNILLYSQSMALFQHHVAEVLQRIREFHLYLKMEKCQFYQSETQFLGYNTSQQIYVLVSYSHIGF